MHLTVSDLDRSIAFYESAIGLQLARRDGSEAALGAGGDDLLVLVEEPDARRAGRHAGLYHFALLYPSRLELARAAQRLIATQTPVSGASDHKHLRGDLPARPGRQRHRAGRRPRPGALGRPRRPDGARRAGAARHAGPDGDWSRGRSLHERAAEDLSVGHLHLHVGDVEDALGSGAT